MANISVTASAEEENPSGESFASEQSFANEQSVTDETVTASGENIANETAAAQNPDGENLDEAEQPEDTEEIVAETAVETPNETQAQTPQEEETTTETIEVVADTALDDGGNGTSSSGGVATKQVHKICYGVEYDHDGSNCSNHEEIEWQEWTQSDTLPDTAGNYFLNLKNDVKNVTLSSTWNVPQGGVNLCLNTYNIICESGYAINISEGCTLNLTDCMEDGTVVGRVSNSGTLNIYGGSIIGGVGNSKTFNMYGGSITGATRTSGGGVYNNYGTFTMNGGSISGNSAEDGGGVYNEYYGTFIMNGGEITGNTATKSGGAIYNDGTFTMNGGSITKNVAGEKGGGVYNKTTFTIKGGSITSNTASENGGGIFNYSTYYIENTNPNIGVLPPVSNGGSYYGSIYISGNVTIKNNTKGETLGQGTANNIYLQQGRPFDVGNLGDDASIGVTSEVTPTIDSPKKIAYVTNNDTFTENDKSKFTSDNTDYSIGYDSENKYVLLTVSSNSDTPTEDKHVHPICGASCSLTSDKHSDITWTEWTSTNSLPDDDSNEGYYYLTNDVVLPSMQTIKLGMKLCLNGHNISLSADAPTSQAAIYISKGVTVLVTNCKGMGGFYNLNNTQRRCFYIDGGELNLYGGTIHGWRDNYGGAGVYNHGGKFYMYGGKITGNVIDATDSASVDNGGGGAGVLVDGNGGIFYLYGGEIVDNYNYGNNGGGGVCNRGKFYAYGGTIKGNRAKLGAGVYNIGDGDDSTIYLTGDIEIVDNILLETEKQDDLTLVGTKIIEITDKLVGSDTVIAVPIGNLPFYIQYKTYLVEINDQNIKQISSIKIPDNAFKLIYDEEKAEIDIKPYVKKSGGKGGSGGGGSEDEDDGSGDSGITDEDNIPTPTSLDVLIPIVEAEDRIPNLEETIKILLEDIDNVKNSEDYIGSVFIAGRRPTTGQIVSGLILPDGSFVEGILYYDGTFVSGTTDENNLFISNSNVIDDQKLVCYIDENGYPLTPNPTATTDQQNTIDPQSTTDQQNTTPTKDSEPKTGDKTPPLATLGMIAGLAYLMDYFAEKKHLCLGMTKAQKDKLISFLVGKAKGKNKFIRMSMLSVIFLILVFYHSIGKIVEVDGLEMNCE
jgi:hypothetical protein